MLKSLIFLNDSVRDATPQQALPDIEAAIRQTPQLRNSRSLPTPIPLDLATGPPIKSKPQLLPSSNDSSAYSSALLYRPRDFQTRTQMYSNTGGEKRRSGEIIAASAVIFTRSTTVCIDNTVAWAAFRVCSICCTWHFLGQDNATAGIMNAIIDTHCVLGEWGCACFVLIKYSW